MLTPRGGEISYSPISTGREGEVPLRLGVPSHPLVDEGGRKINLPVVNL